ncbi:MAG: FAD-dependent oxidoreductase [Oscillospiraceae bacterium]|nr:FAD-dependent oxidoreductase [Oscillospiraceae bacterium]
MYDVIIIGGGPAGLTAAVYARRAGKSVLVLEKDAFGGQIAQSPRVENYPGFASISGAELADAMLAQAMEQGAEVELEEASAVRVDGGVKTVVCASGAAFEGRALILAAGAKPRMLGLAREAELTGSGVSYCAVCDGAFYKDRAVAVVGGGSSALQDALLLSETCARVYLVHRRDSFRGEQALADALRARMNVEFVLNARVTELLGAGELTGVTVEQEGGTRTLAVEGLFVAVGTEPELAAFAPLLRLDAAGCADAGEDCLTPTAGVFVAGDCRKKAVRQLTTATADGAVAALAAVEWLDRAGGGATP